MPRIYGLSNLNVGWVEVRNQTLLILKYSKKLKIKDNYDCHKTNNYLSEKHQNLMLGFTITQPNLLTEYLITEASI
ncbi:MAG: hypothetical protein SWX82_22450 [Cyanobacteriota bacterium]|nr:hypothetical protein [Cyanobacteriota bacterium]